MSQHSDTNRAERRRRRKERDDKRYPRMSKSVEELDASTRKSEARKNKATQASREDEARLAEQKRREAKPDLSVEAYIILWRDDQLPNPTTPNQKKAFDIIMAYRLSLLQGKGREPSEEDD